MRRPSAVIAAAIWFVAALGSANASEKRSVVVELFTAQGCAACPQANQILSALADRKGVIALTFPVDYWDYVGWKDTFAQPEFGDRQRAYVGRLKARERYTPEMVVEGRHEAPGLDRELIDRIVAREMSARQDGPTISASRHDTRVAVGEGRPLPRGAEVWMVRYDPTTHQVRVKGGENKGKIVMVRNVVRDLVKLGTWAGHARTYRAPAPSESGLKTVFLVQGLAGGRIVTAAHET